MRRVIALQPKHVKVLSKQGEWVVRKLQIGLLISMMFAIPAKAEIDWTESEGDNCPKRLIEFTSEHARTIGELRTGANGTIVHELKGTGDRPFLSYLVAPQNDHRHANNWIIYMDEDADGRFEWIRTFCPIS